MEESDAVEAARRRGVKQINSLHRYEDLTRILYESYSDIFPKRREFWQKMAAVEAEHVEIAASLSRLVAAGAVELPEYAMDEELFLAQIANAASLIGESVTNTSERTAVANALSLERNPIESYLSEVSKRDPGVLGLSLSSLASGYQEHVRMLEDLWDSL